MKWLVNTRLETGEYRDSYNRIQTKTDLFHIGITDGVIAQIIPAKKGSAVPEGIDGHHMLALPSFKDMHNHLDKTYLSTPWKACVPATSLAHRLELEAKELSELAETIEQRAEAMIQLHLANGVNHIRTHVNIDPFIGLKNLHGVKKALDRYKEYVTYDIVAFPQHGLLKYPEMPDLLRRALEQGATMLGALDPGGIDKNIESSLRITMELANEYQVDVDLHLHDGGQLGYYTMNYWLLLVEEYQFKGKTAFSHAFGLAGIGERAQRQFAQKLVNHQAEILTTLPIGLYDQLIPVDLLSEEGVFVGVGCDGFYDSWSPYVSGDVLEKLRDFCEYTGKITERDLRSSLRYLTKGVIALNKNAEQIWPKVGDEASFVLMDVASSAQAVARVPKAEERVLIHRGKIYNQK